MIIFRKHRELPQMKPANPFFVEILVVTGASLLLVVSAPAQDDESAAVSSPAEQISFPREIAGAKGTVVIHTPQIDTWKDFRSIEAPVSAVPT